MVFVVLYEAFYGSTTDTQVVQSTDDDVIAIRAN